MRKRFKTYEIGYVHIDSCELRHADGKLIIRVPRLIARVCEPWLPPPSRPRHQYTAPRRYTFSHRPIAIPADRGAYSPTDS